MLYTLLSKNRNKMHIICDLRSGVAPKTQKAAAMAAKSLKKHKSPVDLFVESTKRPREEYSNLSLEEKYKWITKAISLSSDVRFGVDIILYI